MRAGDVDADRAVLLLPPGPRRDAAEGPAHSLSLYIYIYIYVIMYIP